MHFKDEFYLKIQPNETSCGPSCLYSIYKMLGAKVSFVKLLSKIQQFQEGGGTLSVVLGIDAIERGYEVDLHAMNINIFDPSWFQLSKNEIKQKLMQRLLLRKNKKKEKFVIRKYIEFIELGGNLIFGDVTSKLLIKHFNNKHILLVGLSATWLYQSKRENSETNVADDITGDPVGHFVLAYQYDKKNRTVFVGDPYPLNPSKNPFYHVPIERFITSLHLGIYTYDANILIVKQRKKS